jgi:8-oxo-dGTP diphosphatase
MACRPVIRIAAAVIRDARGRHLLVRKRGTRAFMQAGGKIDPGEAPLSALARELREELGLEIDPAAARSLGLAVAEAANEPGHLVHAYLFEVTLRGAVEPRDEIEELLWLDPADPVPVPLAPLTRFHVLGWPELPGPLPKSASRVAGGED